MTEPQRKLAAVMMTDVVGYSSMMSENEDSALKILDKNRSVQKPLVEQFHGKFIKEMGDGTLCSFDSIVDAVKCALKMQETFQQKLDFKIRIGVHFGEISYTDNDIFGDAVNVAARLEPHAPHGGIALSKKVHEEIRNKISAEFTSQGLVNLKGISGKTEVFTISSGGIGISDTNDISEPPEPAKVEIEIPENEADAIAIFRRLLMNEEIDEAAAFLEKNNLEFENVKADIHEIFAVQKDSGNSVAALAIAEKFEFSAGDIKPVVLDAWNNLIKQNKFEEAAVFAVENKLSDSEISRAALLAYQSFIESDDIDDAVRIFEKYKLSKEELLDMNISQFNAAFNAGLYYKAAIIGHKFGLAKARTTSAAVRAVIEMLENKEDRAAIGVLSQFTLLNDDIVKEGDEKEFHKLFQIIAEKFVADALIDGRFKLVQELLKQTDVLDARSSNAALDDFKEKLYRSAIMAHNRLLMNDEIKQARFICDIFALQSAPIHDRLRSPFIQTCEKFHLSLLKAGDIKAAVDFKNTYRLLEMNLKEESLSNIQKQVTNYVSGALRRTEFDIAKSAIREYELPKEMVQSAAMSAIMNLLDKKYHDKAFEVNAKFKINKSNKEIAQKIKKQYRMLMDDAEFLTAAIFASEFSMSKKFVHEAAMAAWEGTFRLKQFEKALDIKNKFKLPKEMTLYRAEQEYWECIKQNDTQTAVYIRRKYGIRLTLMQWVNEFIKSIFGGSQSTAQKS